MEKKKKPSDKDFIIPVSNFANSEKKKKSPDEILLEKSQINYLINLSKGPIDLKSSIAEDTKSKLSVINNIQRITTDIINKGKTPPIWDNLISIVSDIPVLIQAYTRTRNKTGATTSPPGQDLEGIDGINIGRIERLSLLLKDGSYIPAPVSQILIPKPGSTKKRPLGITLYNDKLVSEAIRMVLNAIYDPIFEKQNSNHGFRPNRSSHSAVRGILFSTQGLEYAIEGDIKAAYPSVNHNKLIYILKKRIKCRAFLDLIRKFLNAGIFNVEIKTYENTYVGGEATPQGQIASPILFNIYMHEFDVFITEDLIPNTILPLNENRNFSYKTGNYATSEYRSIQRLRQFAAQDLKQYKITINKPISNYSSTEVLNLSKLEEKYKNLNQTFLQTNRLDPAKKRIFTHFVRYADDWILFTNVSKDFNDIIKTRISSWLLENLFFTLDDDKTYVTNLHKSYASFLGFAIGYYGESTIGGTNMFINIDEKRILRRLMDKGFIQDLEGFPREIPAYSTLNEDMCISKFNAVLLGMCNYYYPVITTLSQLSRIGYIISYSCFKTLCQKKRISLKKFFNTYSNPVKDGPMIFKLHKYGRDYSLPIYAYPNITKAYPNLQKRRLEYESNKTISYPSEIDIDSIELFNTNKNTLLVFNWPGEANVWTKNKDSMPTISKTPLTC